jgi:rRNA-processing protein FCF1
MTTESARRKEKINIILDSNAYFVPIELKIDIFEELKTLINRNFNLVILRPVKEELERLAAEGSPEAKKKALCALEFAHRSCLITGMEDALQPDDAILEAAARLKWPVFTNDRELRTKLRNINVPVIYVRQKSRLELDGRL